METPAISLKEVLEAFCWAEKGLGDEFNKIKNGARIQVSGAIKRERGGESLVKGGVG